MKTNPQDTTLKLPLGKPMAPEPRIVRVTPALAEKLLGRNTLNRALRAGRVERYARDMLSGAWKQNGDTIKFTAEGDLLDGQHRLFAIMEAGVPIDMLIVEGLDPSVMHTIDTGAARSFGDVLAIGGGRNTKSTAAALRWFLWYDTGDVTGKPTSQNYSHSELAAALEANPDITPRISEAAGSKARRFLPPAILGFVYTKAYRIDPARAGAWLSALGSGVTEGEKHPVHQLRERMIDNERMKAKMPPIDVCALAIKSWNNFVTGKRTSVLVWKRTEPFPQFAKPR